MTKIDLNRIVIYDIETLTNLITFCFISHKTNSKKQFVLFDDIKEFHNLMEFFIFLKKNNYTLIGFNCLNFDAQIIEYIIAMYDEWIAADLSIQQIVLKIYDRAQYIITLPDEEKFKKIIPEWRLNFPTIDLFKQKHYDGKAKQGTSLKWIEFTINFPNVEEMPISHDSVVTKEQIDLVLSYNWNDVLATQAFFEKIKFETELRINLSEKYNMNLVNASEPRIAKSIFGKFLCEQMQIDYKDLRELKTFRHEIEVKNIIFPYVRFQSKELNEILEMFRKLKITPLGGSNANFAHSFSYAGVPTDLGLGGIHACCDSGVYASTDQYVIHDLDVASFYPNLAIQNNIKPEHLGDSFSVIYNKLFQERKLIPKKDPINYVYKIILNSTYGLSKEINSYLYDPEFTYSITLNGQLSILMLVEMLWQSIPNIKVYQENTDGVTIGYDIKYKKQIEDICKKWCEITKLELEHAFYKKMVIVDVNNYIAISDKGKIKKKGLFETFEVTETDKPDFYHKNISFLIIPKALEEYYVNGKDYKEYIMKNRNIHDFLAAIKKKKDFALVLKTIQSGGQGYSEIVYDEQQKVTRYFASKEGGRLVKKFHGGKKGSGDVIVLRDSLVTVVNKIEENDTEKYFKDVNYNFYFNEVKKVINKIDPLKRKQMSLF